MQQYKQEWVLVLWPLMHNNNRRMVRKSEGELVKKKGMLRK